MCLALFSHDEECVGWALTSLGRKTGALSSHNMIADISARYKLYHTTLTYSAYALGFVTLLQASTATRACSVSSVVHTEGNDLVGLRRSLCW